MTNVFADLGLAYPDEEQSKADLVIDVALAIDRRGLSPAQAGRAMGMNEPELARLLRGQTGPYSADELRAFVRALRLVSADC